MYGKDKKRVLGGPKTSGFRTKSNKSNKMTKLSKKKVRNAIPGSLGIYAIIAKRCEVKRSSITRFLKKERNKNVLQEIEEEREKILDVGERKLIELINQGEFPAIKFMLSTKGKGRGYVEKQEIEHIGTSATIQLIEMSDREIKDEKIKHKQKLTKDKGKQETNANPKGT